MGVKENKFRRVLSKSYKADPNKVKISSANTYQHEMVKAAICTILIRRKHEVVTEAIFEGGGRADVFDLTTGVVYEVLHTEDQAYFESKKDRYPQEIVEIVPVKTGDLLNYDIIDVKVMLEKYLY